MLQQVIRLVLTISIAFCFFTVTIRYLYDNKKDSSTTITLNNKNNKINNIFQQSLISTIEIKKNDDMMINHSNDNNMIGKRVIDNSDNRTHCIPEVFIIGCQKCGSTSLQ